MCSLFDDIWYIHRCLFHNDYSIQETRFRRGYSACSLRSAFASHSGTREIENFKSEKSRFLNGIFHWQETVDVDGIWWKFDEILISLFPQSGNKTWNIIRIKHANAQLLLLDIAESIHKRY